MQLYDQKALTEVCKIITPIGEYTYGNSWINQGMILSDNTVGNLVPAIKIKFNK